MRQPVDISDPQVAQLIADLDADIVQAAGEVDRTLIEAALALSPLERVDRAARIAAMLRRYRRVEE
jgi:hypothetical protein